MHASNVTERTKPAIYRQCRTALPNVAQSSHHTAYLTTRPHKLSTKTRLPRVATILGCTMRSRLTGLASKSSIRSHTFSTTPISQNMLKHSFFGDHSLPFTSTLVTAEGFRNIDKYDAFRAEASLKHKDAHNCSLFYTPTLLYDLPVHADRTWKEQAGAVKDIIENEQALALVRHNITVSRHIATIVVGSTQTLLSPQ